MPEHTPAPTPARSLYGFFLYLFSKTILVIYCIWALTPDYYLHYFNIYYYPQKYWATAVPIQMLVALKIFAVIIYPTSNLLLTPNIDSLNTIEDSHSIMNLEQQDVGDYKKSNKCICLDIHKCSKNSFTCKDDNENSVPPLHDLNIRFVCKRLYFKQ